MSETDQTPDMFSPDGALEAFKQSFDPADEEGGIPMMLHRAEGGQVTVLALAMDIPMQQMLQTVLPTLPRPEAITLTAESWVLDPKTREPKGECVLISGVTREAGVWARMVKFQRDAAAGTVEWEDPEDIPPAYLGGGVPTILLGAMA